MKKKRIIWTIAVCLWIFNICMITFDVKQYRKYHARIAGAKEDARKVVGQQTLYKVKTNANHGNRRYYSEQGNGLHAEAFDVTLVALNPEAPQHYVSVRIDDSFKGSASWARLKEGDTVSLEYFEQGFDPDEECWRANYIEPRRVPAS